MIYVEVCVGSSCHIKGSPQIVEMLRKKIEDGGLGDDIILMGSFCTGRCNRVGVTIKVGDEIYTGITPETFGDFWTGTVLPALEKSREG